MGIGYLSKGFFGFPNHHFLWNWQDRAAQPRRNDKVRIEDKVGYLMSRQPIITLRLGDRYANVIVGNDLHRISLKFNSPHSPAQTDYRVTFQHRAMVAMGFTTRNGHTYSYDDGEHDIWVRFHNSKISLLKDNLDYVSSVSFRPKLTGELNKIDTCMEERK